jgi:phthiocerol/phenolphthiocerol synthesis type-I polyketide synthase E
VTSGTEIAVVGVGCRFPDARDPREFWGNLDNGVVSMRELPEERLRAAGFSDDALRAPDFVRVGTTLPGVADFAAEFFGYPPREAETIDPQQRIFLEACWEALEAAGHPSTKDGPVTGVFAGSAVGNYSSAVFAAKTRADGLAAAIGDLDLTVGGQADFMTSRAAYKLGFRGPSVSIQTGCSSSLYAVHYATLSLLSGECDIALAGGATVLEPLSGYRHTPGGWLSEDGYCRSFDAKSSGTTYSSGVGVVALRRLSDALADGDPILAVLRGSAVGNDGADRLGYTAPTPHGVAEVVAGALRVADVSADQLRYVEAHGTATPLGDHIELLALTQALRETTTRSGFCGLGSVMTNIGHTGPAAGIAGFIKAVHVASTGVLPPHPMFENARDPGVLEESPFFITTTARECTDADRHVLVNSMGVGGTNVSAVLAAPPAPVRPAAPRRESVRLVLSARTRSELDTLSKSLAETLEQHELPVGDVAHTLRVGRHPFEERRVVTVPVGADDAALRASLSSALRLPRAPVAKTVRATPRRAIVVLPEVGEVPPAVLDDLVPALSGPEGRAKVVRANTAEESTKDAFWILVGHGTPGKDRHLLPVDATTTTEELAERIDEAVSTAWLNGVEVTWSALAEGTGRRVELPTYPFTRKRYWALDRLSVFGTPEPAPQPSKLTTTAADSVEEDLIGLWRELFGLDTIGLDDEFGALGGTSLLSVRMVLEIQQRYDVLINVHRAGGSRATVRRVAEIVRGLLGGAELGSPDIDPAADGDGELVDADLTLDLGEMAKKRARGKDFLLTGATGFLGAFLLHELLNTTRGDVYCVVRADTEEQARDRLRAAAEKLALPEPDPARVHPVPGDLRDIAAIAGRYRDGVLAERVGHVLHCAAKVVFTEPYRTMREDNVLPMVEMLRWMRGQGIRDFSFISTVAATGPAMGTDGRLLETRQQPLDPQLGGYGVSKWVGERLLERADQDGMRIRVFRPGLILASTSTGACNDKDLIWSVLASGIAVGARPLDDRGMPVSPVDILARGVVELAVTPGSVGRAYHLVDEKSPGLRRLFEMLADAGLPTEPVPLKEWQQRVAKEAMATGNEVLSSTALFEVEGHELDEDGVQATGWQSWLRRKNLAAAPTGDLLRSGLAFLAARRQALGELLPNLTDAHEEVEV